MIWTTTPWTLPGNRAIAFSPRIAYGRYRVTAAPGDNWAKVGATYILAQSLAASVFAAAKVEAFELVREVKADDARRDGLRPSAARRSATVSSCRCSMAITSPRTRAPASFTPRPATAARTSSSGWRTAGD